MLWLWDGLEAILLVKLSPRCVNDFNLVICCALLVIVIHEMLVLRCQFLHIEMIDCDSAIIMVLRVETGTTAPTCGLTLPFVCSLLYRANSQHLCALLTWTVLLRSYHMHLESALLGPFRDRYVLASDCHHWLLFELHLVRRLLLVLVLGLI